MYSKEVNMFLVQASSVSWSGGSDLCMNKVDGKSAVNRTIERIHAYFSNAKIIIIAPQFDEGGELNLIQAEHSSYCEIFYGYDHSPLHRMVEVTNGLDPNSYFIRVDGLNMWFDTDAILSMSQLAVNDTLDMVKFPDDFPVQFTSEIYRVGAIRNCLNLIKEGDEKYLVHLKHFMINNKNFRTKYLLNLPHYNDDYLEQCREEAKQIYVIPRLEVNSAKISSGDQLSFHYELAKKHLSITDIVLDIASGEGYGAAMCAPLVNKIFCGDYDYDTILNGRKKYGHIKNLYFDQQDVTNLTYDSNHFDVVLSMETVEHIQDDHLYLSEIFRVLKKNGLLILSTPQNIVGHIPINSEHVREYSFAQLIDFIETKFSIVEAIGIKSGTIIVGGDPIGTNTLVVARK